jgi:hypothetical protein
MLSLLKGIEVAQAVGNCDIDFFRHCFCIMKPKFPKVERDQNVAEKFRNGINESEKF